MKVLPHEAQEQFYGGFGLFVKCVKQGHGTQVTVIVCEPFVCQRCFQKKISALNLIYFLKIALMNIQQNIRH